MLRRAFEKQGMRIVLGRVHTAGRVNGEPQITLKTGEVLAGHGAVCDRLVDTKGLGLDSAGVKLNLEE